jgi:hypothetical protein
MIYSPAITRLRIRAIAITKTLGYRVAAGYLRNQGVKFELAYELLFNRAPRM